MANIFLQGTRYAIAQAYSLPAAITAITNANPAVATVTGTAPADGSFLLMQSGWPAIDGAVVTTSGAAGSTFNLEGINSTDTFLYPAAEGAGTYVVASDFLTLPKVWQAQTQGGEPQTATRRYIDDPTGKEVGFTWGSSARTKEFMLDYNETLPYFDFLVKLTREKTQVVFRETLTNKGMILSAGTVWFDEEPDSQLDGLPRSNRLVFNVSGQVVRIPPPTP